MRFRRVGALRLIVGCVALATATACGTSSTKATPVAAGSPAAAGEVRAATAPATTPQTGTGVQGTASAATETAEATASSPADTAAPTPTGLGACPKSPLAAVTKESGPAPIQYPGGKWTKGPTKGCTITDQPGRTYEVTAAQNRMLYRVNEMRVAQNRKDGKKRPLLKMDFCLQELASDYAAKHPPGHNPFLTKMYKFPKGGMSGSGTLWIGENRGGHFGYSSNKVTQVDILVYNWYTSGSLDSGHYGTMMSKNWGRAGFGFDYRNGSDVLSYQNFSANPAYYAYPGGKKCSKPPTKKYGNSSVPPTANPPGF